ncbi:hypothetical protein YTPLAS73_05240 [Nitrosarchaeum sp.]|nr:hypothetical protein YTPLAS73_05240 [Nitrosarchaeum sp.]
MESQRGTSVTSQAKKTDPTAQVSLIQDESVISYGSCGIPYVIEGVVESFEKLIIRSPQVFKEKQQIDIITNTKATKIDPKKKIVYATNTNSGKQVSFDYDSLVIATGARAIIPPIKGIDQQGVFTVRSYSDGVKLRESTKESKSCILVGAGLVGLEMAEAYKKNGLDVTIIEMADRVLPNMLNENFSNIVSSHLKDNGVKLRLGKKVEEIMTKEDLKVVKTDREKLQVTLCWLVQV